MMQTHKYVALAVSLIGTILLTSCLDDGSGTDNELKQFNKEQKAIDEYLSQQGADFLVDPIYSLKYILEGAGNDTTVDADDYLLVSFEAFLLNGETPVEAGDSVIINLAHQLPGLRILLPKSESQQTITMFIPSFYAYGISGSSSVGPNATLKYVMTIHKAYDSFDYQTRLIDNYLEANSLTAEIDSVSKLRYIMLEEGTGENPTRTSNVRVTYKGELLDGTDFDSGTAVNFNLANLISGWGVLMPYVKEDGKIRMFLPSKYGYGINAVGTIPPNSILVFEVELNEVL